MATIAVSWAKQVAGIVAVCLPLMVTFDDLVGFIGRVDGPSMQPTLNPANHRQADVVWIKRWGVCRKQLPVGSVVALRSPSDPEKVLVKRVVAQEGETIQARDSSSSHTVPDGHIWVEGENASNSRDSNLFGPVSLALVMGRASYIVWPLQRWGPLEARLSNDQMERRRRPML